MLIEVTANCGIVSQVSIRKKLDAESPREQLGLFIPRTDSNPSPNQPSEDTEAI